MSDKELLNVLNFQMESLEWAYYFTSEMNNEQILCFFSQITIT